MQRQLQEVEKYWTRRAESYSKVNQEELEGEQKEKWLKVMMENFPRRQPEKIRVLDIGTGPGFFAIILAEQGFQVTAVDYTEKMLKEAKENAGALAEKIQWYRMDAQNLEFQAQQFDVVVSRNLTWNLDNPEQAYGEWYRVLKKDGVLLNFDANWYKHLIDQKQREAYEKDRQRVAELGLEDCNIGENFEKMDALALNMPMTYRNRPAWDEKVLKKIGFSDVWIEEDAGRKVWSRKERVNNGSTPMFQVCACR